jgi:hypothetical protein
MISKINYLLLSTMMIAAIDSTFGSCCHCPGGKEEENINNKNKWNDNKVNKISNENIETFKNSKNNDNETENLINNESFESKNENINDQNSERFWNQEQIKNNDVSKIVERALLFRVICKDCQKNKNAINKIFVVYDLTYDKNNKNGEFEMLELDFCFCEKHKTCIGENCEDDSGYLTLCGHRMCKTHLLQSKHEWKKCPDCENFMCCQGPMENFGKHLWCHTQKINDEHYFCYSENPNDSPVRKREKFDIDTWVCPKHQLNENNRNLA